MTVTLPVQFERGVGTANLIGPAFGHVHKIRNEIDTDLLWADEMGHPEAFAPFLLWPG
jgi:hypothetical protein